MKRLVMAVVAGALALTAQSTFAQDAGTARNPTEDELGILRHNSGGLMATIPTRIEASRREMNRGFETNWATNPTPMQIRTFAERALERGGFHCTVAEAVMVDRFRDNSPIVEVACEEDGGLVIADTNPVQFSDCFDLVNATGAIGPCRIPRNVALVTGRPQPRS